MSNLLPVFDLDIQPLPVENKAVHSVISHVLLGRSQRDGQTNGWTD